MSWLDRIQVITDYIPEVLALLIEIGVALALVGLMCRFVWFMFTFTF